MNITNSFQSRGFRAAMALFLAFTSTGGPPAFAQDAPTAKVIESIEFTGLKQVSRAFAMDIVRLQPGDAASSGACDDAVDRLLRTGRFVSAKYRIDDAAAGARVTFEVRERTQVTAIKFEGQSKYRARELKKLVNLKVDDPIDLFAARDGREAILAKYREAGFSEAKVTVDENEFQSTGELLFKIDEGVRTRVRKILIEGNQSLPEREVRKKIQTKTAFWFIRPGAFDENEVDADVARIQGLFRDEGFLDAKVAYRTERYDNNKNLRVIFTVEEGTRYAIESIEFTGASVFGVDELTASLASKVGDIAKPPKIDSDARTIQTRYGELGYIDARVRPIRVFSSTPGLVRITMAIAEGEQFRVGDVVVRGNARTKDKVVRRALNLYPPDDLFNLTEARDAERRLRETRIFSAARVTPVGEKPGVRDLVVDVTESEKSGDFIFGFGVTSNSGVVGNIVLDLLNFDINDRPRTFEEFVKFRSFFGGGQRMRIELQPGTEVNRFRIDFTEPYLFDKPLRFDTSFYLFERDRDGYTENRIGGSVSLGKKFERGWLHNWSGEVALRTELVNVDNVDILASNEIRDDEGNNFLTGVKGTLVRDRTDNRLLPTTGDRYRVAYEQFGLLGGDHAFGKFTTGYTWYKTLAMDELERKHVLELRAETGAIVGDAPVFERFYAGGTGSIRGFEFRGVGPRDGLDRNNVGGDSLLLLGAEYSYPLYGDNLRGLVFLDSGTVDFEQMRVGLGAGVRFTIDIFGGIPIELNLTAPVAKDDEDEEQVFSFLIGGGF